jgi:hypothetical protein
MKNFNVLLVLQILTLAAAVIGASAYFLREEKKEKGVVKGILYTGIDSSVMVDNQVLMEGDIIYGTEIVKIYPKIVEFRKNGKCWSQRICERPDPLWNESELCNENKEVSSDICYEKNQTNN